MAPSRNVGIIITFASKPSSVIFAFNRADDSPFVRNIMVIDIRNEMCLVNGSFTNIDAIHCDFDETNNKLIIHNLDKGGGFSAYDKAIVIPLYSTDLP